MNQELTTEQKARVFAMHYGSKVQVPHPWEEHPGQTATGYITGIREGTEVEVQLVLGVHAEEEPAYYDLETAKLLQRPLSAITDEDAIEVAKIGVANVMSPSPDKYARVGRELIEEYLHSSRCNVWGSDWMMVFQFLAQQGYAAPVYLAPGHPLNGKTPLEMGIAVEFEPEEA